MKSIIFYLIFSFGCTSLYAQSDFANTGIIHISSNTDTLFINDNVLNSTTATLVNNGNVYINGNLINDQVSDLTGSGTIFLNGTSTQAVTASNAFYNLTINKTSGYADLLTNVKISGNLHFISGNIYTGVNSVHIPTSGTVTGASQSTGWVNGYIKKSLSTGAVTKLFEAGDAAIYAPVSLTFPNITSAGDITVNTVAGDHPNIGISIIIPTKSVNRHWFISNNAAVFNSYTSTFNFNATDIDAGANTSLFGVGLFDGTNWSMLGTSFRNPTNIRAAGYTTFGSYAIGETFIVVPVTFVTIKAFKQDSGISVRWLVENEQGIKNYDVERSSNGLLFNHIKTVNATQRGQYAIKDTDPLQGDNFYRIRSIDHLGIGKYSSIVNVKMEAIPSLLVYPNPVSGTNATLQLKQVQRGFYKMQVFNSSGMNVKTIYINHPGGTTNHTFMLGSRFSPGTYEILLTGPEFRLVTSLIKE